MSRVNINVDGVLRIGQPVTLCVRASDVAAERGATESDEMRRYNTLILDVSLREVIVAWPTDQTVHVPATIGQPVTLEIRCHLGVLCLDSQITEALKKPIPVLHIARDGDWSRSQLRNSFRLDVSIIPHETVVISTNGHDGGDGNGAEAKVDLNELKKSPLKGEPVRAVIRNLSAAGLLLATATPLGPRSLFRICFPLDKGQPDIRGFAVVVRVLEDLSGSKTYPFKVGCQFLDLGMREQDNITKFILAKQAELRRKGLL